LIGGRSSNVRTVARKESDARKEIEALIKTIESQQRQIDQVLIKIEDLNAAIQAAQRSQADQTQNRRRR
jgi:hypothetical protein